MDAIVEAALRKWPNVPHCHGWLALDARGQWYMRDERTQAAGDFAQVRGSRIEHDKLLGFIRRNYTRDAGGAAYFQNGPQRVYVDLEAAPWVWRLQARGETVEVSSHCGDAAEVRGVWLDEHGRLFLDCGPAFGLGIVHTLDMDVAAGAVERGLWQPLQAPLQALQARHGVVLRPRPAG